MADEEHVVDDSKLKLPEAPRLTGTVQGTNEDNADVIYKHRAKLYRLDEGEWKERCLGDVKLLKDRETGRVRLIMFQEANYKLRANFYVPVDGNMQAHSVDPKLTIWTAVDYSEESSSGAPQTFMLKVRDETIAEDFRKAFKQAADDNREAFKNVQPGAGAVTGAATGGAAAATSTSEATSEPEVPEYDDLSAIYGDDAPAAAERYDEIVAEFRTKYGAAPEFFAHAPGRVNLIGEHIDYHMYSVLPFALRQDVVIAVGTAEDHPDTIKLSNLDSAKFPDASLPSDPSAAVDQDKISWQQYFHSGYKGFFDHVASGKTAKGLNVLVHGTVPPAGGVSSSSAFVVASLLATAAAYDTKLTRKQLGTAAWKAEAYVGTMGGGMDQAISAMAETGKAARIDFLPELRASPVPLPENAHFVVANSLVASAKAAEADRKYNRRVTEGKLAAKLIAKKDGKADWKSVATVRDLQKLLGCTSSGDVEPFLAHLKDDAYSIDELKSSEQFDCDPQSGFADDPQKDRVAKVFGAVGADEKLFFLKRRLRHILSEAQRVVQFEKEARAGGEGLLERLGELMDASHASCRDDYECSVEELDQLVQIAKSNGAVGARLTGAGWGGCIVALVPAGKADAVIQALKDEYYAPKAVQDTASVVFATVPSAGAAVYKESEEGIEL